LKKKRVTGGKGKRKGGGAQKGGRWDALQRG